MRTNKVNSNILIFLFCITMVIIFMISCIAVPASKKDVKNKKTYDEMLEYSHTNKHKPLSGEENSKYNNSKVSSKQFETNLNQENLSSNQEVSKQKAKTKQEEYNELLDSLKQYPAKSINSVEVIVNKLLKFKGYPENTIQIITNNIDQSKAKTQGSYLAAYFDFTSGNLYISQEMIYTLDVKVLIAILAHELDHFDKIAGICKSLGVKKFQSFLEENNVKNINDKFWEKAIITTDITNFDAQYYQDALKRFITQNNLELVSSYSDFYRFSENMRNPLEISAYEVSDYIYSYYNIPIVEGPMQKLTKKFNETDWAIYKTFASDNILQNERIALFDYFFMQAIIKNYPDFKPYASLCINEYNGDLTSFWIQFENSVKDFYGKGKIEADTLNKMMSLLDETEKAAKKGITTVQTADALKYKVNTLLSNIVYPNAIKNIQITALDYIKYVTAQDIQNPSDELKFIIILICIENEIYSSSNKDLSLYYLKIPDELSKLYNIQKKNRRYHFIYNNSAFKELLQKRRTENNEITEQALLLELLNKYRLNIKYK